MKRFMIEMKRIYQILHIYIKRRCERSFGRDVCSKLYYRVHACDEGFALTHSVKRDTRFLESECISDRCVFVGK